MARMQLEIRAVATQSDMDDAPPVRRAVLIEEQQASEAARCADHARDGCGFHVVAMGETLDEGRRGGGRGVESVQCLPGQAVWDAAGEEYDPELLADALARNEPPTTIEEVQRKAKEPALFIINYTDGTRAEMFCLNYAVLHWAAAWRYEDGTKDSTLFWLDEEKTLAHFTRQVKGIEQMMLTGVPAWPVERTLLTSALPPAASMELATAALFSGLRGASTVLEPSAAKAWAMVLPRPPLAPVTMATRSLSWGIASPFTSRRVIHTSAAIWP